MLHDEKFWRLSELLERDVARMLDDQAARVAGFQDVEFDPLHGVITYIAGDQRLWTAQVEAIGTFSGDVNMFRWSWSAYDRPAGRSRLNVVFSEGQRLGIPSLTTAQTPVQGEAAAIRIANVAAALARASGVYRTREPDRLTFYAMFEVSSSAEVRGSPSRLPPPRVGGSQFPPAGPMHAPASTRSGESVYPAPLGSSGAARALAAARTPIMSMLPPPPGLPRGPLGAEPGVPSSRDRWLEPDAPPPAPASPPPQPSRAMREPARELLMPLANLALTAVVAAIPSNFHQALLTIDVTVTEARARFSAVIVASDANGDLIAVTTPQAVMDAIGTMILEDAKSGNGRWSRLVLRFAQKDNRVVMKVQLTP